MKKIILALLIFNILTFTANKSYASKAGNYIGCISEESLSNYNTGLTNHDENLTDSLLLSQECILVGGKEYSILDRGFITSKIRVYSDDGEYTDVWVPSEAVR